MSIQELRARTNAGIVECSKALKDSNGDVEKAVVLLRERGIVKAENYANRTTSAGTIGHYIHHDGSVGVLVGLASETDFVARMPEFKELACNLAMHAAGKNALYGNRTDVPADMVEKEIALARKEFVSKGMNEEKISKILPGKMDKFYEQIVLLDQPYLLNDKLKVSDVLKEFSSKVKEKIEVRSLAKMHVSG
jgi:elongation factor Ts